MTVSAAPFRCQLMRMLSWLDTESWCYLMPRVHTRSGTRTNRRCVSSTGELPVTGERPVTNCSVLA